MITPIEAYVKLMGQNKKAATIVAGGLMFVAGTMIVINWVVDSGHFDTIGIGMDTLARVGIYFFGFCVCILLLINMPTLIPIVIGWLLTGIFTVWSLAVTAQILTGNAMPWPTVSCLVFPFSDACAGEKIGVAIATEAEPSLETDSGSEVPDHDRVYLQFAGSMKREEMITITTGLASLGWTVPEAERGGERTGTASGLNEIRFFHESDRAGAEAMAVQLADFWQVDNQTVGIRDFSQSAFSTPSTIGLIEIWISN